LKEIIHNFGLFNSIDIKSMLIYYYHDLENRTSYIQTNEDLFIKYTSDNIHINKEDIFLPLRGYTEKALVVYKDTYLSDNNVKELISFLYYLDNKYFLDILTLFMLTVFPKKFNVKESNLKGNEILLKEIELLTHILGI
jgi:hypothetical protein